MKNKVSFKTTCFLTWALIGGAASASVVVIMSPTIARAQSAAQTSNEISERVALEAAQNAAIAARATLKPVTGRIELRDAKAFLNVPAGYGFLDKAQAKTLLVDVWGNPPGDEEGVLGILVKLGTDDIGDPWGAVITYDNSGYVTDTDAADIKPEKLLADEQAGEAADNAERTKAGYGTAHLVGWAEAPSYDSAGKRIYWAKRLQFSDAEGESLNYNIRVLGREGYLALNFVATMDDLAAVKAAAPDVLKMAEFNEGSRYADYKDGDTKSGLGLAGLVAGAAAVGVAKKVGLLGLLIAFGKKGFVVVLLAFGWLWNKFKGLFSKKPDDDVVGDFSNDYVEPASELVSDATLPVSPDGETSSAPQNPPSNRV